MKTREWRRVRHEFSDDDLDRILRVTYGKRPAQIPQTPVQQLRSAISMMNASQKAEFFRWLYLA